VPDPPVGANVILPLHCPPQGASTMVELDKIGAGSTTVSFNTVLQPFASVTGSARNKENLYALLRGKGVDERDIDTLSAVFSDCETGIYTQALPGKSNEQLLAETKDVLERLNKVLF